MERLEVKLARCRLSGIVERWGGGVVQAFHESAQAILLGTRVIRDFAGTTVDAPDVGGGFWTKITVKVDGDVVELWQNWTGGCIGSLAAAT